MLALKNLPQHFSGRGPLIHVVLDGWGVGEADETNAIYQAVLPVMSRLTKGCPYTQLWTHGLHVGLPNDKRFGWFRSWAYDDGCRNDQRARTNTDPKADSIR